MNMTRRQFAEFAAALALLPMLPRPARATGAPVRRLVVMTSLGTNFGLWRPLSAPGQALQLSPMTAPLEAIKDKIIMVDGLSFNNPLEGHSTPQTLTGKTFGDAAKTSIDQVIARGLNAPTKLPSLLLGVKAKNEGQFWLNDQRIAPLDSPVDAFNTAFGSGAPVVSTGVVMPRKATLDLLQRQLGKIRPTLGAQAQQKLDDHVSSVSQMQKALTPAAAPTGCVAPNSAAFTGDPEDDASTCLISQAHFDLMAQALACDVTRVAGLQWGLSYLQYNAAPNCNNDEHALVHSGQIAQDALIVGEQYLAQAFCNFVLKLKNTQDPLGAGNTSLLDNTLVIWARDIGDGPTHKQFSMPYVLAGATGYLNTNANGRYVSYGGDNDANTVGTPHERLLVTCANFMGVSTAGFGKLPSAQQTPLPELL